jgi:hypothetical protein
MPLQFLSACSEYSAVWRPPRSVPVSGEPLGPNRQFRRSSSRRERAVRPKARGKSTGPVNSLLTLLQAANCERFPDENVTSPFFATSRIRAEAPTGTCSKDPSRRSPTLCFEPRKSSVGLGLNVNGISSRSVTGVCFGDTGSQDLNAKCGVRNQKRKGHRQGGARRLGSAVTESDEVTAFE